MVKILKEVGTGTGIGMIVIGTIVLYLLSQFDELLPIELSALGMTIGIVLVISGSFICLVEKYAPN